MIPQDSPLRVRVPSPALDRRFTLRLDSSERLAGEAAARRLGVSLAELTRAALRRASAEILSGASK